MKQRREFQLDLTETFPRLPASPVVEAVLHWHARAGKTILGDELRKQLGERLPEYPEYRPQHQLELQAQFTADGSSTQVRPDNWHGFRLTSRDRLQIVQFTRDGIVFSRLAPYDNWDAFAAEGRRLWRVFVQLAEPSEVQRLGVRFINRILPVKLADVGHHLASPPKCLEPLGLPMSGFLYQSLHDVPAEPFQINVVQTLQPPAPPQPGGFGLILDIDVFTTRAFLPVDDILGEHLAKMRWLKNKVFFGLMSKRAIKSFSKGEK